ncbi:IS607 family transposase, partial [Maribrevibacterium harenarium]
MKLSDWARKQGISYRTAWNQFRSGKLPVPARQLPTGTIIVDEVVRESKAVIYTRVSSSDKKKDLDGQIARCLSFANAQGIAVSATVSEIGS